MIEPNSPFSVLVKAVANVRSFNPEPRSGSVSYAAALDAKAFSSVLADARMNDDYDTLLDCAVEAVMEAANYNIDAGILAELKAAVAHVEDACTTREVNRMLD